MSGSLDPDRCEPFDDDKWDAHHALPKCRDCGEEMTEDTCDCQMQVTCNKEREDEE